MSNVKVGIVVSSKSYNTLVELDRIKKLQLESCGIEIRLINDKISETLLKSNSKLKKILGLVLFFFYCIYRVKKEKIDVIMNLHHTFTDIPICIFLGRIFGIPIISRLAGTIEEYKALNPPKREIAYFWINLIVYKRLLKLSHKIIVFGPYERKRLLKIGISAEKIEIIPPVPPNPHKISKPEKVMFKRKLGLPQNSKVVLFVGRVTRLKGAHILEKIARELEKLDPNVILCVVGDGDYVKMLKRLKNVVCLGVVEPSRMLEVYGASDLLILPSLAEGLPNVILEALSYNVPVVASRVGENPWVVSNTFNDASSFINYIIKRKWKTNRLPAALNRSKIRFKYCRLFAESRVRK